MSSGCSQIICLQGLLSTLVFPQNHPTPLQQVLLISQTIPYSMSTPSILKWMVILYKAYDLEVSNLSNLPSWCRIDFLSRFWVGRSLQGTNQASQEYLLGFNQVLIEIRAPYSPIFLVKIDIRRCFGKKKWRQIWNFQNFLSSNSRMCRDSLGQSKPKPIKRIYP